MDVQLGFLEGLCERSLGHGHAHQIFGLLGGEIRIVAMHP